MNYPHTEAPLPLTRIHPVLYNQEGGGTSTEQINAAELRLREFCPSWEDTALRSPRFSWGGYLRGAAISDVVAEGYQPCVFAFFFSPLPDFLALLPGLMLTAREVVLYKSSIGKCVTTLYLQNQVKAAFWGGGGWNAKAVLTSTRRPAYCTVQLE